MSLSSDGPKNSRSNDWQPWRAFGRDYLCFSLVEFKFRSGDDLFWTLATKWKSCKALTFYCLPTIAFKTWTEGFVYKQSEKYALTLLTCRVTIIKGFILKLTQALYVFFFLRKLKLNSILIASKVKSWSSHGHPLVIPSNDY